MRCGLRGKLIWSAGASAIKLALMLRDFFTSPNFLALLRFWEGARAGRVVPDWNGDLAAIPTSLLSRIIVIERREALIYRYLGMLSKARFGRDPTGVTVAETLSPGYAAYLADLIETALVGGAPVFSSSVLHQNNLIRRTGRLVAPFTLRGSAAPCLTMSAHLEVGEKFKVTEVLEPGGVLETERIRISAVADLCARLEEARRYYQLSRAVPDRSLASEWSGIAAKLAAGAIVPLRTFRNARDTHED
jgi:hypothetical protein